jgi:hypothetical protein
MVYTITQDLLMVRQSVLDKVAVECARCSLGLENAASTMTLFATALLLLNLAGLTGVRGSHSRSSEISILIGIVSRKRRI